MLLALAFPQLTVNAQDGVSASLAPGDWPTLREARIADRHAVCPDGDGFRAHNPAQHWVTRFDRRGFTTQPDSGAWTWGLQLESFGFRGHEQFVCEPVRVTVANQQVGYDWNNNIQEWWVNDVHGLEHGYTIRERPRCFESGLLNLDLSIRGSLRPDVQQDGRGVSFVDEIGATVLTYAGLVVTDADGVPLAASFVTIETGLRLSIDERDARYPVTIDPLAQQAYLKASNTDAGDRFGAAVAMFGDTLVVGAPNEDSNAVGPNGDASNNGAAQSGAVYVFVRNGTGWNQQAYLKASNTDPNDQFGSSVALWGDTLVVGAYGESSSAGGINGNQSDNSTPGRGAAYVFVRTGTTWSQQAYLKSSNGAAEFGASVSISHDTVVVGATADHSVAFYGGGAFVFVRTGVTWNQEAYLRATNPGANDSFGGSVAIADDTIVVGAPHESSAATGVDGNQLDNSASGAGAAYVFVRSGSQWFHQAYLKASNTAAGTQFGTPISISGDTVVIGSLGESSSATGVNGNQLDQSMVYAGAAYAFVRNGSTWSQQAYLKASNTNANDLFGSSISLSGDRLAIGAVWEASDATGIGGNQNNNNVARSGAAYLFERNGGNWYLQAYAKASNTGLSDWFGSSIALFGQTLVVAASGEASTATGVGGDQSDNGAFNAGAAYAFEWLPDPVPFCFGDGTDTACPCGNVGAPARGCNNSGNSGGASLISVGVASVSADTFALSGLNANPSGPGLYFQGSAATQASTPFGVAFGNGLLCISGTIRRLQVRVADGTGASATTLPIHLIGGDAAGDVRYYQLWYRDTPSFGTCISGFNLSSALTVTWLP